MDRRTFTRSAVWAAPVVAVASAAPAFAVSEPTTAPLDRTPVAVAVTGPAVLARCATATGVQVSVTSPVSIVARSAADVVTVTLPAGLAWLGATPVGLAANTRTFSPPAATAGATPTTSTFTLDVGFTANGTAGVHMIDVSYRGKVAQMRLVVTAGVGTFHELNRQPGTQRDTAALTATAASVPSVLRGSTSGDEARSNGRSTGNNSAILLSNATVELWGTDLRTETGVSTTFTTRKTLAVNSATVTGVRFLDTWTSEAPSTVAGHQATGGIAAGSLLSETVLWFQSGGSETYRAWRPGLGNANGSGKVLGAWAFAGFAYVLVENDGIAFCAVSPHATKHTGWQRVQSGDIKTGPATLASAWGHHRAAGQRVRNASGLAVGTAIASYGVAAVVGSKLTYIRNNGAERDANQTMASLGSFNPLYSSTPLPTGHGTVVKLTGTDSGVIVLFSDGTVHTFDTGDAPLAWLQRASGIADFAVWGYDTDQRYLGGSYLTVAGTVKRFLVSGVNGAATYDVLDTGRKPLTDIRRVESSDGTYVGLKADGTVYGWAGNSNHVMSDATVIAQVGSNVPLASVDIGVWGFHDSSATADDYTGGGFVLVGDACPVR